MVPNFFGGGGDNDSGDDSDDDNDDDSDDDSDDGNGDPGFGREKKLIGIR